VRTIILLVALVWSQSASAVMEDFHEETVGSTPSSFSTPTGWWSISTDGTDAKPVLFEDGTRYSAQSGVNTIGAQAFGQSVHQFADTQLTYYPLALLNSVDNFSQGTIEVEFAIAGGDLDTDSGIVFDYQPSGDYLALREDTDESQLILFSVSQGQQSNLAVIDNVPAELARWHRLRLVVATGGTHISGWFDDQHLMDVDLATPVSGQVGAIAKTDTVVLINSFTVDPNPQ
jgi:hypothetical protein